MLLLAATPAAAGEAWIPNQTSEDITVVDLATGETLATIPVGGKPAGVAVAPQAPRVYVTSPDGPWVSFINTESRAVEKRLPLEGGPLGIATHPLNGMVYVADWYGDRVYVIDPDRGVIAEIATGDSPSGVAVTPDGRRLLTADRDSNQISVFDAETYAAVATIPVGERPFGVTVDGAGRFAYTANVASNDVSIVDLVEGRETARVPTGERPYAVALANGRGFSTDQYGETVTVFSLTTHEVLATLDVGEYPEGVEASADETRVYVANWFSNTLSVIDTETLEVTGEIATGDGPRAFGRFLTE